MAHLVIISTEKPLREALSDIVSRELAAQVTAMETSEPLAQMPREQVDLVITTGGFGGQEAWPVLQLIPGEPRKMAAILAEAVSRMADKHHLPLALTETIYLHDKPRKLERSDTGTSLELTEKEQALLLFVKSEGEASREDILKHVWGMAPDVTTHTLDTHLYRLRQKWRELAETDCIIATEGGYRWYDGEQ